MTPSVLVLDDERTIVTAISRYLSVFGWPVVGVQSVVEAKTLVTSMAFDAAVVDLNLNDGNPLGGLELIRHARLASPSLRCIVCTANDSSAHRAEAAQAGAFAYVTKPVPLTEIAELIQKACIRDGT
jgi:CheY-like chemotaxis protein